MSSSQLNVLYLIVPYRDRLSELETFLDLVPKYLSAILSPSTIYSIIVAEQQGSDPFNRGLLFNTAVRAIMEEDSLQLVSSSPSVLRYLVFHDVDIVPLGRHDDYNFFSNNPCGWVRLPRMSF